MKTYFVNINTSQLWDTSAKAQIRPQAKPFIPYQEIDSLILNLVDNSGLAVDISDYTSFEFSADNNFIHSDALMIYSSSDNGDITILDAVNGKIKVSYNANTSKFDSVTSGLTSFVGSPFFVELIGFLAGDADGASLLRDTFYAVPRVKTIEGLPVPLTPLYLTKVQTIALMQISPEYQFSVDGIAFHLTQTANDRFYQTRYPDGEWSASISIIVGKDGIDGETPNFITGTFDNSDLSSGILIIAHSNGNVNLPCSIEDDIGKNITLDDGSITYSNNRIFIDFSAFGTITGTWKYTFGGTGTGTGETPTVRYVLGEISGAVTIERTDGDYQVCTTAGNVTGITISNLATETGMILRINNPAGYTVTWGTTEIITATDTGSYVCAFYTDDGVVCYMGKSAII